LIVKINKVYLAFFFAIVLLVLTFDGIAQKTTKVQILKSDVLKYDKRLGNQVRRLIGHVVLKHDSTYLYCDSAYMYELKNSFDGFGNVRIKASDTLNIYSEVLNYNGNNKLAELHHNVRMVDNQSTLYTEHLWYDRQTNIGYYTTGGKIVDSTNTLTSVKGYYYTDLKQAYFKDSVVLVNPEYTMHTDTMRYHVETEVSWFFGPTIIQSEDNLICCENGWYDTKNNKSQFNKNAYMLTDEQKLEGDSLYYDRELDFGQAFQNVIMSDTVQDMLITGNYAEFKRREGFAFVTDSAQAIMVDKHDSLFMHSDTLWMYFDSEQNLEFVYAYHKTKFFRKDMQGMSDSLIYSFADSTIFMYKEPVLWSDQNQLTSDSIRIALANNQIDTLALMGSAFIISMDDTLHKNTFNQIKGKVMVGYFKENKMKKVHIYGNAESVFYVRDEKQRLTGINKTSSSDMNIYLDENEVVAVVPIKSVDSHMYPDSEVKEEDKRLKNFKWIDDKRPKNKGEIFIW
jgi:lipopolysaccharide export system protein LptA